MKLRTEFRAVFTSPYFSSPAYGPERDSVREAEADTPGMRAVETYETRTGIQVREVTDWVEL